MVYYNILGIFIIRGLGGFIIRGGDYFRPAPSQIDGFLSVGLFPIYEAQPVSFPFFSKGVLMGTPNREFNRL